MKSLRRLLLPGVFLFTAASAVRADAPPGEPLLPADPAGAFRLTTTQGNEGAAALKVIDAAGPGFTRALHIETSRDLSPAWAAEVRTPLTRAVESGDVALVRFHARALSSADETGSGLVRVAVQLASAPYTQSLETTMSVGPEWREYLLPFSFRQALAAGAAELTFGLGFKRQVIEIGGVEIRHYGKAVAPADLPRTRFTYAGREADAPWRQAAIERIEKIRKSNFMIEIRDAAGAPAAGAKVRVEQVRSAFQFGTAVQFRRLVAAELAGREAALQSESGRVPSHDEIKAIDQDNRLYREKFLEFFNAASPENDLKWPAWEGDFGAGYDRANTVAALRWLKERNIPARGHVLVWPGWRNLPESVRKLHREKKDAEIPARVKKHIAEITAATAGLLDEWDVLNEPYDNHDLMGLFGPDIMVEWFTAAREGAPDAVLYLNDYSNHDLVADKAHCENFFRTAKFLLEKGAPLTGLGLQAHIGNEPNPPERVLATLDVYATLKLPIRFTEFDINTEDEELQADYTRDFLILAYSHPSVVGVQHWGFWERAHWRPRSALFRADWSEKPGAKVFRALVLNQWRTRLQGAVGASAKVGGRGYHGDYKVTVEHNGKVAEQTFTLRAEEARTVVRVTLP
ncbi:MAG TPA: endo-1,4-beta-xylanase [Opitutaceae bacterium]|nr:endo-1,4-beta-xylanase [Opitutaceae bacterium]